MTLPRLLGLYVLLVLYLCLYPWNFHWDNPQGLWSWNLPRGRAIYVDAVLNFLLFVPFGAIGATVSRGKSRWLWPLLGALMLSAGIEALQRYLPVRDSSAWDIIYNTSGTLIGIVAASVVARSAQRWRPLSFQTHVHWQVALLLLLFAAAQLFPFIPRIRIPHLRQAAMALAELPDPGIAVTAFFTWMAAAILLGRLTNGMLAPGVSVAVLLAFLVARAVFPAGIHSGGAILASVAGIFLGELWSSRMVRQWLGPALLLYLAFRQLYPFQFVWEARQAYWVPFDSIMQLNTEHGLRILLEKSFVYAAAIWALRQRVGSFIFAALACAGVLGAGEFVQQWSVARTPDSLDPILALLAGMGLAAIPSDTPHQDRC